MKIGICADLEIRLGGEGVRPRRAPRDNLTNCPGPLSSLPQQRSYKSQELSFSLPEGSLGSCDALYIGVQRVLIRDGVKKSKWKFKMAFAMKGGGVSRGSRLPLSYFEK